MTSFGTDIQEIHLIVVSEQQMSKLFLESMPPDPLTFYSPLTKFLSQTPTFFRQPPTSKHFESPASSYGNGLPPKQIGANERYMFRL